jgi:hypothetical protein
VGLAPDNHRLADGEIAEPLEIGLEPPDQPVVAADDAIVGDRDDDG